MECSRGVAQFACLVLLCFVGIPIWLEAPIRLPPGLVEKKFRNFISKYNKTYGNGEHPEEFQKRLGIFTDTLKRISEMNALRTKQNNKELTASYGITRYSDLTEDEFLSIHLNKNFTAFSLKQKLSQQNNDNQIDADNTNTTGDTSDGDRVSDFEKYNYVYADKRSLDNLLPVKVDWRGQGFVPAVRKQGSCGACWAYSVISNIESALAINNQTKVTLSTQQMVDCAQNGNKGCGGGDTCLLLEWLKNDSIKIETESQYPMTEDKNSICSANDNLTEFYNIVDFSCDSYVKKEDKILHILATRGPVTVAVNALLWQHYLNGIIQYHCDGSIPNLNHAVLIVGYDRSGPIPYYIVQNSWGSDYGDDGYIKIAYGNNVCGIATQVSTVQV